MLNKSLLAFRGFRTGFGTILLCLSLGAAGAHAQQTNTKEPLKGERYVPAIWVDPDGCEHWVMDDGVEGYMSPHVNRQGIPVCRRGNLCGVINNDQYFASNSARISPKGVAQLRNFFATANAKAFSIAGHTDNRASDKYNMRLSLQRARAVAHVARQLGANVVSVSGYGERVPKASNATAAGMAKNRRVEITCIR